MHIIMRAISNIGSGCTINIKNTDMEMRRTRLAAHDFACEFWDAVFEDTDGDSSAIGALYTTLATLIEREKLYQVAFDLLYGFHLSKDTETAFPAAEICDKPKQICEFVKTFLLFSQIILEGIQEDAEDDAISDYLASIREAGP